MELGDFYYRQGYKIVEKSIIFAINHFRLISLNCRKIKVLFILKFEIVKNILDGIPHTPPEDGLLLYNFILKSKPSKILELGFQHGVSTLYMAAALDEIGFGEIITIDRQSALHENPSIETLLNKSGLNQYVKAIYANYSYTWELMKIIRDNSTNQN